MRKPKLKIRCSECNKTFWTTNDGPECPRCGSVDIELVEPPHDEADEAYERAAARARSNDFAATGGRDWT